MEFKTVFGRPLCFTPKLTGTNNLGCNSLTGEIFIRDVINKLRIWINHNKMNFDKFNLFIKIIL